jgi:copper chaperone NosL
MRQSASSASFLKKHKMKPLKKTSQIALIACSLLLIVAYFVPVWRIDLWAPQYPEGLSMGIWLSKLSGQVDIINGLNHYIGMAIIKEEMFPEFKILPYAVGIIIAFGVISGFSKNRKMVWVFLVVLIFSGIVAMVDFWTWGYDYGHNLSDDAAIKVPGMAYQPPLIGYKELLNFGAYSIPDIGGWLFVLLGVVTVSTLIYEVKYNK